MKTEQYLQYCICTFVAIHTLRYDTAITPAISFTTGELDGEQFVHYDSNITEVIPKTEWIKKISAVRPEYWKREREWMWRELEDLQHLLNLAVELFNHTKGVHTLQRVYGCELDDDGTIRGYDQFGYDGEDFISLNLTTGTWTAAKPQAEIMTKWDPDGRYARDRKYYLEKECIELLTQYMSYRREALERKVRPEASLFQNHSSSPEVVCHATGFFPKALNISWQKDGEEVHEDVELRETLPNQDGSFQKRSVLIVTPEALQKHTYTCVIQHSSSEKELVLPVSERRILRGRRNTFL
ncbi:hypothetical protein PDJAM_G00144050 [Pangasius djambal]|uniref:Uncharacterized protein n=1 Tax=Pangasius djambal TaxID=1691987 RepID=A0ACC5ZG30_9TELE|nr:hypothetical protein [Pangasius djambal]